MGREFIFCVRVRKYVKADICVRARDCLKSGSSHDDSSILQGVLAVDVADLKGKPVSAVHLKGSLVKGRRGSAQELQFSAKGAGSYEASVPKGEMAAGTHQ